MKFGVVGRHGTTRDFARDVDVRARAKMAAATQSRPSLLARVAAALNDREFRALPFPLVAGALLLAEAVFGVLIIQRVPCELDCFSRRAPSLRAHAALPRRHDDRLARLHAAGGGLCGGRARLPQA
jgi:hypothetical protein